MKWYDNEISAAIRPSARKSAAAFRMNNRGTFTYSLADGADNARLKIFDSRGRLIKTVELRGPRGTVSAKTSAAQTLFWRVDANGKTLAQGRAGTVR
jgi:hypothetical protein